LGSVEAYHQPSRGTTVGALTARCERTFIDSITRPQPWSGMLHWPDHVSGPDPRGSGSRQRDASTMPAMDHDPIPTEPTTDVRPPEANSFANGPSQAWRSQAAGRGSGLAIRRLVTGLALALTFTVGIGVGRLGSPLLGGSEGSTPNPADTQSNAAFGLVKDAWDILHQDYVGADELDDTALVYGAIEGLTDAVGDTGHTSFLTPQEREERAEELSGSYVGIGVRIDAAEDGRPLIVGVFRGSPAEAADLQPGDIIVAVEGEPTLDQDLDEVASRIRGEAGSTVSVTIQRGVDGPERTIDIERAEVDVETVSWAMVPGSNTAMLRLEQFSNGAADDLKAALLDIRAAGADRVILDLRGNPGGFVNEAIGVASQFLASGTVYVERNAAGEEQTHPVTDGGVATDVPLVVLIDGLTASSAEIVSGALQDAGRGQLIGETTYGTGTVLGEFPLADGSALRVGTTEWLTPKGRRIWHEGIVPDVSVARAEDVRPIVPDDLRTMTAADADDLTDPQLARALAVVAEATVPAT
jgi:carboxyl-terminal processing protease